MRQDHRKLMRRIVRRHAPLSDAQLAFVLKHFGMKPGSVRSLRHRMTKSGEIRFANKTTRTSRGQAVCLWEAAPKMKDR